MSTFIQIFVSVLALMPVLMSLLVINRLGTPTTPVWWAAKMFATAPAPILVLAGLLFLAVGVVLQSPFIIIMGSYTAVFYAVNIFVVTRPPDPSTGFDQAFGQINVPSERSSYFLKHRYALRLPNVPDPVRTQDVPFYTFPDTNRELLCDIWEPPREVTPSGLAFIYIHGSAWYLWDKDAGTRPFFRHLASQGHVIMDVAYRLYPETDMMGMVHDVRHAVSWMKQHAYAYNVDPKRIVLGGGSAGGHLSLMTAYTEQNEFFRSIDLSGVDTRVKGVIALYGPTDLEALYFHTGQDIITKDESSMEKSQSMPEFVRKRMGDNYHRLGFDKNPQAGLLPPMLGGHPEEIPEIYARFSPVAHVNRSCPPTLLIQGTHDIITPEHATKLLFTRLQESGVPAVMHMLPQIDHAFDLVLPRLSPSAHNAWFDVERFLALMSLDDVKINSKVTKQKITSTSPALIG